MCRTGPIVWDSGSAGNYYSDYNGTNPDGEDPHPIPDGILTPADAVIALTIAANGGWDSAADVSGDKRITSLDALMILKFAGGATWTADDGSSADRMRIQIMDVVT